MSRSIKKGPYVHEKLAKKVDAAQRSGNRDVINTWSRASTIMPDKLYMMEEDISQYLSQKIWWVINWENLLRPGLSGGIYRGRKE